MTTCVLDVPTAYAFFGQDPQGTLRRLDQMVQGLSQDWNSSQAQKSSVSLKVKKILKQVLKSPILKKVAHGFFSIFLVGRTRTLSDLRLSVSARR